MFTFESNGKRVATMFTVTDRDEAMRIARDLVTPKGGIRVILNGREVAYVS